MKKNIIFFILLFSFSLITSTTIWAKSLIYTSFFSSSAISGYDPVAYFTQRKPVKGNKQFVFNYKGAKWYFSSDENLKKFKAKPDKFSPQYGGYCAWAVAQGYTAEGNPNNWTIYKDKLYLNYDDAIQNKWLNKIEQFVKDADKNWPQVLN
jgi:YHS domain-containing protein